MISIRLPESLLNALKTLANERDVPYQSLVKIILAEQIKEALHPTKSASRNASLGGQVAKWPKYRFWDAL